MKTKFVDVEIKGSVCPFDGLPCSLVSSCDDVMAVVFGLLPPFKCSRAVLKAGKK